MSKDENTVLKCGYMRKQTSGKVMSLWKERYFALYFNCTLKYYYCKTDTNCRTVIDLSTATNMSKMKATRFTVDTASRLWNFKLKTTAERDAWFQQIFVVWQRSINCKDIESTQLEGYPSNTSCPGFLFHKIFAGETLTDLCATYAVSPKQLKQYNKNVSFGSHLSGKWILIPTQSHTNDAKTSETTPTCRKDGLTTEHLLLLLDAPDPYLYFIYTRLMVLCAERDDSIVDKMLEQLILKFEVSIQMSMYNILQFASEDHKSFPQIAIICEMEDQSDHEHKILTYSCEHWMQWIDKQGNHEEIHIRDFAIPNDDAILNTMNDKLRSVILHCVTARIKGLDQTQSITEWMLALENNMNELDDIVQIQLHAYGEDMMHIYVIQYYTQLIPMVMHKLNHIKMEIQDTISILSWMGRFKQRLVQLKHEYQMMNDDIVECLSEKQTFWVQLYVRTSKEKWLIWVNNIVRNECAKREFFIIQNVPRVHCVQDLFTVLNHQLHTVTHEHVLHGSLFNEIVMLILHTVDQFYSLLKQYIETYHTEFEDEYCCALINSIYDVVSKLTRYQEEETTATLAVDLNALLDAFDERISLFTRLGKQCARRLSYKICADALEQNIFEKWFTLEYFNHGTETNTTDSMILTVKEYLGDFSAWIEEKYFVNVVCKCLVKRITDEYVKALIRNEPRTSKLIQCIRNDVRKMNLYFGDEMVFSDSQFQELWKDKYQYLEAIHFALETEDSFFSAYSEVLEKDTEMGEVLLQYIVKKRKIQHMDHVLGSRMPLRRLRHNKVAKNIGKYMQKRKEKKNKQKKLQNEGKKKAELF
eukprot:618667_1